MKRILTKALTVVLTVCSVISVSAAAPETDTVSKIMQSMSLRDKIIQMLVMELSYWDEDTTDEEGVTELTVLNDQVRQYLEDYNFGGIIYFSSNLTDTEQSFVLTNEVQKSAVKNGGIPMIISADQEGGIVYRLNSGTALPGNMALGAAGDVSYAEKSGEIIGSELSALGINTNLSPVLDINNNANNPVIGLRSYSDDPDIVGKMASAVIAGMEKYDVIGCAKHFPGHGDTDIDSHYGLPVVDKSIDVLEECELAPYKTVISNGLDMVMTAHILYPQLEDDTVLSQKTGKEERLPASMSDDIIGLLKEKLGFDGIVITDAMNMAGIADYWDPVQAAVISIQAGADMLCMPCGVFCTEDIASLEALIVGIENAVKDGSLSVSRIDDAVKTILTVKEKHGILDWDEADYSLEKAKNVVGCEENRKTERDIAAAAVTLIQNKNNTLPLKITSDSKVLMMVPYNNETAQMIMGWNRAVKAGLVPDGAEVKVVRFDRESTLETFKAELDWADTVIMNSEVGSASLMNGAGWVSAYPLTVIDYVKSLDKTVVIQSVDTPYDVQSYPAADAVIAVYGCKGTSLDHNEVLKNGITESVEACGPNIVVGIETILGVIEPCGKLPVNVPKIVDGEYADEIVFERGYGLSYKSDLFVSVWFWCVLAVVILAACTAVIILCRKKRK